MLPIGLTEFLWGPEEIAAREKMKREAEERRFAANKHRAVDWDLWKTKAPTRLHEPLVIRASTYEIGYRLFDVKPTTTYIDPDPSTFRERGRYRYYHFTMLPAVPLLVPTRPGRDRQPEVYFDGPAIIPALVEETRWGWQTWMSITPAEIFSQRSGIRFCRGEVVIGGLGLGWFLSEVAKRKQVNKITLVEKDSTLLEWFGHDLCKRLGVNVICDDVYNVIPKMPKTTRFALDIWPDWFDARYDRQLMDMRCEGYEIWAWGSARGGGW